jgi:hypothetical protein
MKVNIWVTYLYFSVMGSEKVLSLIFGLDLGSLFIAVDATQSEVQWQWSNCCLLEIEKRKSTQRTILVNKG